MYERSQSVCCTAETNVTLRVDCISIIYVISDSMKWEMYNFVLENLFFFFLRSSSSQSIFRDIVFKREPMRS